MYIKKYDSTKLIVEVEKNYQDNYIHINIERILHARDDYFEYICITLSKS